MSFWALLGKICQNCPKISAQSAGKITCTCCGSQISFGGRSGPPLQGGVRTPFAQGEGETLHPKMFHPPHIEPWGGGQGLETEKGCWRADCPGQTFGGRPGSMRSRAMQPRAHRSAAPASRPAACSGAMYAGTPGTARPFTAGPATPKSATRGGGG